MVVILVISVVVVIAGTAAAKRLSSVSVRRRRKLIEVLTSAISSQAVAVSPLPVRRPRVTTPVTRVRHTSTSDNVEVLAEYRKVRASRSRNARVAAAGMQRTPRPRRPEPA